MSGREADRLNAAGRPVWFDRDPDGGGVYRPVATEGRRAMLLAVVWVLACGLVFPVLMVITLDARWLAAMFLVGACRLGRLAYIVSRHS